MSDKSTKFSASSDRQTEILEPHLDPHGLATDIAPKEIVLRIRGDGRQRGFRFVENPATGALEIPAHMRTEIADALVADVRSLHYRLYLLQAQLYLHALWLKGLSASQRVVGYLKRELL
jgi:hypothetical protein